MDNEAGEAIVTLFVLSLFRGWTIKGRVEPQNVKPITTK